MTFQLRVHRKAFPSFKAYLREQEYRRLKKVIVEMLQPVAAPASTLLDMACWDGEATRYYGERLGLSELFGLDFFDSQIDIARKNGVQVSKCDLEADSFPFADACFDIVVANQIFEHLKQIYRPLSEIHRVLKPGGYLLFSVPNLAALHCRLQLLFGVQPSTIQLFEAHVRGFTPSSLSPFLTFNGLFTMEQYRGSGLYPFPPCCSGALSKLFRGFAVYQLYLLRKTDVQAANWQDEILRRGVQSNF